jgi:nucleotide-binding universal stress UspA family protein
VWSDLISIGLHGAEPLRATSTAADARITLNQVLSEELGPDHGGVHGDAVCGGQAARALLDASEGSAMLVLGAPAHGERARHLGGTAHQVVRHASCPVVIAR